MKSDRINELVRGFLHGDLPKELQWLFRRWILAPTDREEKEQALYQAWNDLLEKPVTVDYRSRLPVMHRKIEEMEHPVIRPRLGGWRRWVAVAALVALAVVGEYLFLNSWFEHSDSVCLVTARNSKGEFLLPDGTTVWLNGDSRLTYPESFDDRNRRVELDGEAFFRVKHDAEHPFLVDMDVMQVEVLGTEFDARHRLGSRYAETILQSGKIRILAPGLEKEILLSPDERLLFDRQTGCFSVSAVAASDYCSWTAHRLVFANKPLSAILVNLERWYNVRFLHDDSIDLSANLSFQIQYESLEETLRLIERIAPVRYEIRNDVVFLGPK